MGLYLRNNRYYFKRQIDGKPYYAALKLRKGQEGLLSARVSQIEQEIVARHFNLPLNIPRHIGFTEYTKKYSDQKKYKKSLDRDQQRLSLISSLWGNIELSKVGKDQLLKLENYLFGLKKKPATVNRYFELLRSLFNLAIEDKYLSENPVRYYQRFVEDFTRRSLTDVEVSKLLSIARELQSKYKTPIQKVIYDLMVFAFNTGMRLSEILNLKSNYIDKERHLAVVPILETKYRKRGVAGHKKVKVVYLNAIAQAVVDKYAGPGPYVFPVKWRNPNTVFYVVKEIRKKTGIQDFAFHQIRHTVASWVSGAVSLVTAKTLLGHSDIQTTMKYAHADIEEQARGVSAVMDRYKSVVKLDTGDFSKAP